MPTVFFVESKIFVTYSVKVSLFLLLTVNFATIFKVSYNPMRFFSDPQQYIFPYFRNGEGPLGSISGFEVSGNYRTGLDNTTRWPDLQLNMVSKVQIDEQPRPRGQEMSYYLTISKLVVDVIKKLMET